MTTDRPPSRETTTVRQLRARVDAWYGPLLVGMLLFAAGGGWLTYGAHVAPQTTTEERVVSSWTLEGRYDHSARVTRANPVFPVGTTLSNRSVYLTSPTPVVNGTLRLTYDATNGSVNVSTESRLVVRSVVERDGEETELWRRSRPLATGPVDSVSPGESVTVPVTVNVSRTVNRTSQIQSALGDSRGTVRLSVVTTVRLTGTVARQDVNLTERYTLPIRPREDTYRVEANGSERTFERTRTVRVRDRTNPIVGVGGPFGFAVGFLGVVALVTARTRGDIRVTDAERARLAFEDEREEFDEWITTVTLPSEVGDRPRAEAASLEDLVDLAIDTDNTVIELPDEERFTVLHDGYQYVYEPPTPDPGGGDGRGRETPTADDGETDASVSSDTDRTESPEGVDRSTDSDATDENGG